LFPFRDIRNSRQQKPPVHQDGGFPSAVENFCFSDLSLHIEPETPVPEFKAPYVSIAGCQTSSRKSFLMFAEIVNHITPTVQRDFFALWKVALDSALARARGVVSPDVTEKTFSNGKP